MKLLALLVALVCFVAAVMYWTGSLQLGAGHGGPHHTHAILFAVLGLLSLVWFRFQGGRARA